MANTVSNAGVYLDLKQRLMMFEIAPGDAINESDLSRSLGISRTPLRSALYRLEAEGFLTREQGRGFRCRTLEPKPIFDLYQTRCELEVFAVRKSCERAADADTGVLDESLMELGLIWRFRREGRHETFKKSKHKVVV